MNIELSPKDIEGKINRNYLIIVAVIAACIKLSIGVDIALATFYFFAGFIIVSVLFICNVIKSNHLNRYFDKVNGEWVLKPVSEYEEMIKNSIS